MLRNVTMGSSVRLVISRQEVVDEKFQVPRELVIVMHEISMEIDINLHENSAFRNKGHGLFPLIKCYKLDLELEHLTFEMIQKMP